MTRTLLALDALALACCLGALVFFAFGLAPVAFSVLPERTLAGNVVNGSMARLQALEALCIGWLLLSQGLRMVGQAPRRSRWWGAGVSLLAALWASSAYLITPPMHALRQAHPVMDALAPNDPDRQRFARLHELSTGAASLMILLSASMVLGQGAAAPSPANDAANEAGSKATTTSS